MSSGLAAKNVDGRDKPGREIQQVTLLLELRRAIR
jgi:hypothetical protein